MLQDKKMSAMLTRSWKKSFNNGILVHAKKKQCNECKVEISCDECNNQVNENKNIKLI